MAETSSVFSHDGLKLSYPLFRTRLLQEAWLGCYIHEHGLTGFFVAEPEYLALSEGIAFEPILHPGPRPDPAEAEAITLWAHDFHSYQTQQRCLQQLMMKVINALHPDFVTAFNEPIYGLRRRTGAQILARLDLDYGTLTAADLAENEARLTIPYDGHADLESYISTHRAIHAVALANGQAIPMETQVRQLKAAMLPCGIFGFSIAFFEAQYPGEQLFDRLATCLEAFDDNRVKTVTSGTLINTNMIAQATLPIVGPSWTSLVAAMIPFLLPASALPIPAARSKTSKRLQYCWSHGICYHSGTKCTRPKAGHRFDATLQHPLGGETRSWATIRIENRGDRNF